MSKIIRAKNGVRNAEVFLEVLARDSQFKNAIETPIGVEVLSDLVLMIKDNMSLILAGTDSLEVRAEIKVCQNILTKWSTRINSAEQKHLEFSNITEGE